jgi:L,D-peptidoglycan transpeptidase YkuD (ErfK/YbiS/YcfS/YnhG family)
VRSSGVWVLFLLAVLGHGVGPSWAGEKPPETAQPLSAASRLVLVETQDFHSSDATISTYERQLPNGAWREVGVTAPAKIGRAGVGWGFTFQHLARAGEPLKREGDKRAPAGIFALSRPFGFGSSNLTNYMQLERGRHVCVDDVRSSHYSRIVNSGTAGAGTSGERMWAVDIYRKGILVDYPTSRAAKAGSCIFVHLWRRPDKPTVGCVAASEPTVDRLQTWANDPKDKTVIAIVPSSARERLPGLPAPR